MAMDKVVAKLESEHGGAYPPGQYPVLLAYAFRPFFLLLPIYLIVSVLLWGLLWGGVVNLVFTGAPLEWHIYEMVFGLGAAGMAGFLLTALPEFFEGEQPLVGKPLLALVLLWLAGRVSFWLTDWLGVYPAALTHLALMLWLALLIYRPILADPLRRHWGLLWLVLLLTGLQAWFFAAKLGWVASDALAILKLSTGAFMILVLLVVRRVNTGVINELFEQWRVDDVFLARPPRYHLAVFMVGLFGVVEFVLPGNALLGWLGLACAAALLNLLNDYLETDTRILLRHPVWALACIPLLMAAGYALMGVDYLHEGWYGVNHFRHFLTTGALGLAYLLVLMIVVLEHTGRVQAHNHWLGVAVLLVVVATLLRGLIPFAPQFMQAVYLGSALLWAGAFGVFLWQYAPLLWQPRADGLPG